MSSMFFHPDFPWNVLHEMQKEHITSVELKHGNPNKAKLLYCIYMSTTVVESDIIERFFMHLDESEDIGKLYGISSEEVIRRIDNALIKVSNLLVSIEEAEDQLNKVVAGWGTSNKDILKTPIDVMNLSTRSYNCLYRYGVLHLGTEIMRLENIIDMSIDDLLHIRNMGQKSVDEIISKVAELIDDKSFETLSDEWKAAISDARESAGDCNE